MKTVKRSAGRSATAAGTELIRTWTPDAARHDGAQLPGLLDKANTGSGVWADTAYRWAKNEAHLEANGFRSRIHRKKPQGKPMPKHVSRANAAKSEVRAHVEHVFARQKAQWRWSSEPWRLRRRLNHLLWFGCSRLARAARACPAQKTSTGAAKM